MQASVVPQRPLLRCLAAAAFTLAVPQLPSDGTMQGQQKRYGQVPAEEVRELLHGSVLRESIICVSHRTLRVVDLARY